MLAISGKDQVEILTLTGKDEAAKPPKLTPKAKLAQERQARLAAEMRENMKKRRALSKRRSGGQG